MKIITSVGTSIFENCLNCLNNNNILGQLHSLKTEPFGNWKKHSNKIICIKKKVTEAVSEENYKRGYPSAEIKSLIKIKEQYENKCKNKKITVYLIAADSIAAVMAAELIKEYFEKKKEYNIQVKFKGNYFDEGNVVKGNVDKGNVVKGLIINNKERFEKEGLLNLLRCILKAKEIDNLFDEKNTALNITGGYKALVPYFTFIGQIYSLPTYYIYEDTEELIKVPQLPLEYDYSLVHENLFAFEDINPHKKKENLPDKDTFIMDYKEDTLNELLEKGLVALERDENDTIKVGSSFIGGLIYQKYVDESHGEKLSNLKGTIMELKLYKYFASKKYPEVRITHSYKVNRKDGNKDFEIDLLVEKGDELIAAEVKPGKNPPISGDKQKKHIEYTLTQGGFHKIPEKFPNAKNIKYEVYLYSNREIAPKFIKQIKELHEKYPEKTQNLKWYHLDLKDENLDNYEVDENKIKLIFPREGE